MGIDEISVMKSMPSWPGPNSRIMRRLWDDSDPRALGSSAATGKEALRESR